MDEEFKKRIGYDEKIDDISIQLCKDYNLGKFIIQLLHAIICR